MLVTHSLEDKRISKEIKEEIGFCLSNRKGGFLNLGISSRYRGLYFSLGSEIIKVIDDIRINGQVTELRNNFWNITRSRDDGNNELFFMPFGTNSMVYESSTEKEIDFLFDVKKAYDNRTWGRNYNVWNEGDYVIVEFIKKTDNREDKSNGETEFSVYIAFADYNNFSILNEWENQTYGFDKQRNSGPWDRYVFKGLKLKARRVIIGVGLSKNDAIQNCDNSVRNLEKFKNLQRNYSKVSINSIKDKKINIAAKCAIEALDSLAVHDGENINLYAGLPWFFQFWSRDTCISLRALVLDKEYDSVKKILMSYLQNISEDGLLPNRFPGTTTKSADGIGWYFKRWQDFIDILKREGQLYQYFKKPELLFVIKKLEESMDSVFKNYTIDSLAMNGSQETWMDTKPAGGRAGARIEIQALRIAMYNFLYKLTEKEIYKEIADKLSKKVRYIFWNGEYLIDGASDATIRPNIFIAAYICPELLSKDEWVKCFENVMPKLWLEWGGIATIDKNDLRYKEFHTGESDESYHNGDSWYWLNNLAAIVLYRIDSKKFKPYIDKIIEASSEDILFQGFIGCHSEISSARMQKAEGCLSQAWSNALFVEMAEEIGGKK